MLFAKNEKKKKIDTLIKTKRIYIQDIGMKFGIKKYAMLIMKSGNREIAGRRDLKNQERTRTLAEKENTEYWGILKADNIK